MDTIVEMYRAIGSKLYSLIHKCRISPVRMKTLTEKLKNLESAEKKYQVSFGILITLINFLCKMGKTFAVCVFMCVCSEESVLELISQRLLVVTPGNSIPRVCWLKLTSTLSE